MMIRRVLNWIAWIIETYQPAWCAQCGYVMFHKDARHELTQWGKVVHLCQECRDTAFSPFKREGL